MKLADYPDVPVDLPATSFVCIEHDESWELGPTEDFEDATCEYDEGHYIAPQHVTPAIPDGVPAEIAAEYWHPVHRQYEFTLDPD